MAELDADFDRPLRMREFPVGKLATAEASFADPSGVVLTADELELDITGVDLEYDSDGKLVGGTITDVDAYLEDELWFSLTDAEASVPSVLASIWAGDPIAFFRAFLRGGDDTIFGSNGRDELYGFDGDDTIEGGEGDDVLYGLDGDDTLDGGQGADPMRGGSGDDRYVVDDVGDRVIETPDDGADEVESSLSFRLPDHVEDLYLVSSSAIEGIGNALANRIVGNEENNSLDGRGDADEMIGRGGDDTYLVDDPDDMVVEEEGQGNDRVLSTVTFELPEHVEKLVLVGRASIDGYGNELDNEITGNDRDNLLEGGGGNDTLRGGKGNDIYVLDGPGDVVVEDRRGGIDTIRIDDDIDLRSFANVENVELQGEDDHAATGNALANRLVGNDGDNGLEGLAGNDVLSGGAGDDVLRGGTGRDRLTGGAGADEFVVGDAARNVATVTDFSRAEGDRLLIGDLLSDLADGTDLTAYLSLRGRGSAVQVLVDADGAGSGRPVLVASVSGDLGIDLASLLADGVIDLA